MIKNDILKGNETSVWEDIKRARALILIGGALYPLWTAIHILVFTDVSDSFLERLAVYGLMVMTIVASHFIKTKPEIKLRILQISRWIILTHYFYVVYKNDLAVQYAMCAYFLVFIIGSLFTSRKAFAFFSVYVIILSILCGDGQPTYPGYVFQLGIATCLLISFMSLAGKLKLIESLKSSETLFRSIFQNSSVGMLTIDMKAQVSMVNDVLVEMLGRDPKDFIGKSVAHWSDPQTKDELASHVQAFLEGKSGTLRCEFRYMKADGSFMWMKISGTIIESHGIPVFAFLVYENITQQKEAESLVEMQQKKMVHVSKMTALGEMSGGLAHEINSPLAIISLTAEGVRLRKKKDKLTDEFLEESLLEILNTVKRISKIVVGLRRFSRDDSAAEREVVALNELITDGLSICSEPLASDRITVKVDDVPSNVFIKCRTVEFSQVLLNLLNNARDSIRELDDKWIHVGVKEDGDNVLIAVTDSGPRISTEVQNKIFQPFFTTKPIGQGVGLGLSISTGIINSFGGALEYDSTSANCRFTIRLPKEAKS